MRILRFFGCLILGAFVVVANALADTTSAQTFQNDGHSYPSFAANQTGQTYPANTNLKDSGIKVATTNLVDDAVDAVSGAVTTLSSNATTVNTGALSTNATAIGTPVNGNTAATGLYLNRIDKPSGSGNTCPSNSICGYISSPTGTNGANFGSAGTKQWVVIQGAPAQ